jgi:hypothetical protein
MNSRRIRRSWVLVVLAVVLAVLGPLASYFINLVSNNAPDLLKRSAPWILGILALATIVAAGWSARLGASELTAERRGAERRQVIARIAAEMRASLDEMFALVPRLPLGFTSRPDLARLGRTESQPAVRYEDLRTIFTLTGQSLLLLGSGGSGKSALLTELCLGLCEDARDEATQVPVLLNLTTWSDRDKSIEQWLAQAIVDAYSGIAMELAREWVEDRVVILLLDGLDELPSQKERQRLLGLLDRFLTAGPCPVVVSCRTEAFTGLHAPQALSYAVDVRTPTRDEVRRYLTNLRNPAADAANAVDERDEVWWSMIRQPIMLGIVARISAANSQAKLVVAGTARHRRRHIISLYVDELMRRGPERTPRYRPEDARDWLAWLATWMSGRTVFYIDRITPSMLAKVPDLPPRGPRSRAYVTRTLGAATIVALLGNFFIAPFRPETLILNAAPVLLMTWFNISNYHVSPTEPIRLVWTVRGRWLLWSAVAIGGTCVAVLLLDVLQGISPTTQEVILITATTALLNIPAVLAYCITPVSRPNTVGLPPGVRLRRSRRTAWLGALLGLSLAGARGVLSAIVLSDPLFALSTTLPFAVVCATSCWLIFGGVPVLQYRFLFRQLHKTGRAPTDYLSFLEWARKQLLLHTSGSALRFPHKEIQRYFKENWTERPMKQRRPVAEDDQL